MAADATAILVSSSRDIQTARELLSARISRISSDLRMDVASFIWKESTNNGLSLRSTETIQNQINELLDGRIELTFVMFGERIGESLGIKPPADAQLIIEEWSELGLMHPWPTTLKEIQSALLKGCFPLTGTVYELFVAMGMERRDRKLRLKVGYVADGPVVQSTTLGDIRFNDSKQFTSLLSKPGSPERLRDEKAYNLSLIHI